MTLLKIGNLDVTPWLEENGLTVEYQVLLSDKSGRNARGKNVVDIVARKDKVIARFRPLGGDQMQQLLAALEPFVFDITYRSPKTQTEKTISIYIGTPSVSYIRAHGMDVLMQGFELSFIEN